jgi:hypothetical protein
MFFYKYLKVIQVYLAVRYQYQPQEGNELHQINQDQALQAYRQDFLTNQVLLAQGLKQ